MHIVEKVMNFHDKSVTPNELSLVYHPSSQTVPDSRMVCVYDEFSSF